MSIKFRIQAKPSKIDGTGAFALEPIPARKKIGNMGGEIISQREVRKRIAKVKRVAMVEFYNGKALDASVNPNDLRYINHSCSPNTFLRRNFPYIEFYALRSIKKRRRTYCGLWGNTS